MYNAIKLSYHLKDETDLPTRRLLLQNGCWSNSIFRWCSRFDFYSRCMEYFTSYTFSYYISDNISFISLLKKFQLARLLECFLQPGGFPSVSHKPMFERQDVPDNKRFLCRFLELYSSLLSKGNFYLLVVLRFLFLDLFFQKRLLVVLICKEYFPHFQIH